jgi:hypothetical protein
MVATEEQVVTAGEVSEATQAGGEVGAGNDEAGDSDKPKGLYVHFSQGKLRERLEAEAETQGKTPRQIVHAILVSHWGLPAEEAEVAARTRQTYATPEAKKEAQKAKRVARQDLVKMAMEKTKLDIAVRAGTASAEQQARRDELETAIAKVMGASLPAAA